MSHLLLVDDELYMLNILNAMLSCVGYSVTPAQEGKSALELIEKNVFDLVITDLMMPQISGWHIAAAAKCKAPETPVILLTGWPEKYKQADLSERGVDLMLAKPVSLKQLTRSVEELMSRSQTIRP